MSKRGPRDARKATAVTADRFDLRHAWFGQLRQISLAQAMAVRMVVPECN